MMDPEATFAKQVQLINVKYCQVEKAYKEGSKIFKDKV
jgi:hypothetical protein